MSKPIVESGLAILNNFGGRNRYIIALGVYGWTKLMVWADHLEDALDEAGDWIEEHEPGHFCDDQVREAYESLVNEEPLLWLTDEAKEKAWQIAEEDTIQVCSGNHYLHSWEVAILCENPTRKQILQIQGRL